MTKLHIVAHARKKNKNKKKQKTKNKQTVYMQNINAVQNDQMLSVGYGVMLEILSS